MKKRRFILTMVALLMTYAAIIPSNGSFWWIGEPQLPKTMSKKNNKA